MGALRMKKCEVDQAVFYCVEGEKLMVLAVHVDDCSAMASSVELENEIKTELRKVFEISDLGEINWILGIAVKQDHGARTIALSQKSYNPSMLGRYGFENVKPIAMPMDPSAHLSTSQCPKTAQEFAEMKNKPYREAVSSLMYTSLGTRPDITYAVGILSRFVQNPDYLTGTP
jgi:Reverse transcriptase (RNA-dependent DNA polymerase)